MRHIRVQFGGYGGKAAGLNKPEGAPAGEYYCPDQYVYNTLKLVDYIRNKAGNEIELLHDTHERLSAINAVRLAKELEPYHLFSWRISCRRSRVNGTGCCGISV